MPGIDLSRRRLLAGAAATGVAVAGLGGRPARSQAKFKIRFSVLSAETGPDYPAFVAFKQIVERETQGGIEVLLYPNAQLGSEREATEQVKFGALEMTSGGGDIQGYVPQVGLFYLPFLYPTDPCFVAAWDIERSPVAKRVAELILAGTQSIRALAFMPAGGTRNLILRDRPVQTLKDFAGVKIRVDTAPTSFKTMQALGAAPTPMAFPEVYNALQTGVIDAAENLLSTMISQKWAEVCKHVTLTHHNRVLHVCMINEQFFQSLPANYQQVLQQAAQVLAKEYHDPVLAATEAARRQIEGMGLQFHELQDREAWMKAAAPLQEDWARANGFEAELAQVRQMCG